MPMLFWGHSNPQKNGKASSSSSAEARLNCARRVHHEVCSLLLSALESLRATLADFGDHLVPASSLQRAKIDRDVAEAGKRLARLSGAAKVRRANDDEWDMNESPFLPTTVQNLLPLLASLLLVTHGLNTYVTS